MQGIVIAGTHSGCGKTTITLGILAALKRKGLDVQPFKAGPDFIDTGLHRIITGKASRNLDIWMCGETSVTGCFKKHSADADIAVVEGVMGMYDGDYNTARLAHLLNLPVILVVDAYGMAESAGAVVKGFVEYRDSCPSSVSGLKEKFIFPQTTDNGHGSLITGVIFNRVASERHFKRLKDSVRGVEVLGYLPRNLSFEIPHRHLGLTVAEENPITKENMDRLSDCVSEHINVDRIIQNTIAPTHPSPSMGEGESLISEPKIVRIALAYDKAFCFYYEDNLDLLRDAGAEIVTFSPLSDSGIPSGSDAVYIGGGYPELYAEVLSKNTPMLRSVNKWSNSGKPLYAECGGLMYLSQGIHDFNSNFFKMSGVFAFETQMKKGRAHLGYREIILDEDCVLGRKGDTLRGHEFHYSEIREQKTALDTQKKIYAVKDKSGVLLHHEGYRAANTLASYIHIHFGSNADSAGNFLRFIKPLQ